MPTVFVLNGPNLNLLGVRDPSVYGHDTLGDIEERCAARAAALDLEIDFRQTNHEGQLVDWIQEAADLPVIEVHLSNIFRRESFRHHSYVSLAATGVICGLGAKGYELALDAIASLIEGGSEGESDGAA